jgi:Reverse transcriptase (RNA-dependent DNA polymerase)
MPTSSLRVVLNIFNEIWHQGKLPDQWKHAIVLPFVKAGKDPTSISSYRPISLTSTLSKLMERLVKNRLEWYLETNQLLSNVQTGFRKGRSTIDQIIKLQDQVNKYINNKAHVLGLFLDFEKAFDFIKLKKLGLKGKIFEWIKDFITNRTIQVRIGNALSSVLTGSH